jgi:undecaprenyl diphosphate synthase
MQSTCENKVHVAIIMDGNGRWAERRGLPRMEGHKAGVEALKNAARSAPGLGISTLTVYAFSSDNWRRPKAEVAALLLLMRLYLMSEIESLSENGIRLSVIGRRDRLPNGFAYLIERAERMTRAGRSLHLRIAIDYSSRDAIVAAAIRANASGTVSRDSLGQSLNGEVGHADVDLLIRTSGEKRLSDFLLWECAYAELYFTPCLWPDFDSAALEAALADFRSRDRRYGGLTASTPHRAAITSTQ